MSKRKYRSNQDWEDLVSDYQSNYSHQSKAKYCLSKGISNSSFCKWYSRLSQDSAKDGGSFVSLTPSKVRYQVKVLGISLLTIESHV